MAQGYIVQLPGRLLKESTGDALVPAAGWKIKTYVVNSTTPKETFSDGQLLSTNGTTVTADADGFFRMFVAAGETIKCVVTDESDVTQYTFDYQAPMIADPAASSVTAVPIGGIIEYFSVTPPTGFLYCDGSAVSRATYSSLHALYAAAGYPFGNGDGVTTFNVPDRRGRYGFGKATAGTGTTIGGTFGSIDHTHTGPSHTHEVTVPRDGWGKTSNAPAADGRIRTGDSAGTGTEANAVQASADQDVTSDAGGTGNTGSANPPSIAMTYMVKY